MDEFYRRNFTKDLSSISTNEINKAVEGLCEQLGIKSGSAVDINLFRLLQAYIQDVEKRGEINAMLNSWT